MTVAFRQLVGFAILLAPWGCVRDLEIGGLGEATGAALGPDAARAITTLVDSGAGRDRDTEVTPAGCEPVRCQGQPSACADCVDNDGDGLIDHQDGDCWGPCDGSESSLGGGTRCPQSDCFFESDCGLGNDVRCVQLAPNGCDCFGCCERPGGLGTVLLGSVDPGGEFTCNSSQLDDPVACAPCTQDLSCINECMECELCFGDSVPRGDCASDAGCVTPWCAPGIEPCGDCAGSCGAGLACVSGCCVDPP